MTVKRIKKSRVHFDVDFDGMFVCVTLVFIILYKRLIFAVIHN